MQIKTVIHENYPELELHVCKDRLDDEVASTVSILHELLDNKISAVDEYGNRVSLKPSEIVSFFAANQKVYALGKDQQYTVTKKLYELEEDLKESYFTRISKSEIVNYKMIKCLDMNMAGTIKLVMKNGYETYTSRRNVVKIKKLLVGGE